MNNYCNACPDGEDRYDLFNRKTGDITSEIKSGQQLTGHLVFEHLIRATKHQPFEANHQLYANRKENLRKRISNSVVFWTVTKMGD